MFGVAKKETVTQLKCLDKANFTLDQEGVLGRANTLRQEGHLGFILRKVVTVSFPH